MHVDCDMEWQLSGRRVLVTLAGEGWAIGVSGMRRDARGNLPVRGRGIDRGAKKAEDEGLDARRAGPSGENT